MSRAQTNPADYAINHWRRYETDDEHATRVAAAEEESSWYFARATARQKAAYDEAMADLRGLDAPRYDRAHKEARRVWDETTVEARALFNITADEIMREDEVSEDTNARWNALMRPTPRLVVVGDHAPELSVVHASDAPLAPDAPRVKMRG